MKEESYKQNIMMCNGSVKKKKKKHERKHLAKTDKKK